MFRDGAGDDPHGRASEERCDSLERAFRECAPRVLDYARHRGATLAEAEDVVSEVFIVLMRRLDDAPDDVLPWLYGVARKVMYNQMRSRRRGLAASRRMAREASQEPIQVTEEPSADSGSIPIGRALAMLSERDREVLILVAWDDLTYDQAARSLGCTSVAFAQMLRRARQRVLRNIAELQEDEATCPPREELCGW